MADGNFEFKVNGFDSYNLLLGEELRGERATLGKSLLQVQKDLKIKAAYISAIENCDIDAFPNKGFIAGYVRSYARYLNLNAEETYERFCTESGFSSFDGARKLDCTNLYKNKGLKNYNIETHLDWKPSSVGLQETNNSLFNKGYMLFVPFLLGFLMFFGVGFGVWKVLIDIQKLKIVPADNLPIIMSEMNIQSLGIINENKINQYQFTNKRLDATENKASDNSKIEAPQVFYRDGPIVNLQLEDIGVLGANSTKINRRLPNISVSGNSIKVVSTRIFDYGVVPEFGDLSSLDGINYREFKKNMAVAQGQKASKLPISPDFLGVDQEVANFKRKKNLVENESGATLNIFAVSPSWIRIKDEGKRVVVEKILKAGEVLEIKANWLNGNLRAGNAKDLFFSLNGVTYGPVSDKRDVIKNFRIDPQNIFKSLKINDLKDNYLNSLLKKQRSL